MVKTGRDYGVFGGVLALIAGYLIISVGLSLLRFGEYPARPGAQELAPAGGLKELAVLLLGAAGIAGGITGIAAAALASRKPSFSWKLMTAAGAFSVLSVFGVISGILFVIGAFQASEYSKSPPGSEPEWQDAESLPY